jgi:hypothetical protein
MKDTKILLPLDEQGHMPNHGVISIQIYKKLIDKGLGKDISFQQFLLDLKIDEETYILGFHYTIKKTNFIF